MIRLLRVIQLLRKIDGLCFKKRAVIKLKLFGKIWYHNEAKVPGDPLGKEFYSVPIFFKSRHEPLRIAIHEVRHRAQWNHPQLHLLALEDVPVSMRPHIRNEVAKKMSPREIDAQIFDEISLPLFVSGQINAFLKLMFEESQTPKES